MDKIELQTKEGVTYSFVQAIGGTRLIPLFYKHIAELMEADHCTFDMFRVTDDCRGVIAEIDNKIVGYGVFDHNKKTKELFDFFTYVDPDYRQRGIFLQLQNGLLTYAKINKVECVNSFVSVKNEVSVKAHRKAGFDLFLAKNVPGFYQYIHTKF